MEEIKRKCGCIAVLCAGIETVEKVNPNCAFHKIMNEARHPKFRKPYIGVVG